MKLNKYIEYKLTGAHSNVEWINIIIKILARIIMILVQNKVITEEQAEWIVE